MWLIGLSNSPILEVNSSQFHGNHMYSKNFPISTGSYVIALSYTGSASETGLFDVTLRQRWKVVGGRATVAFLTSKSTIQLPWIVGRVNIAATQ